MSKGREARTTKVPNSQKEARGDDTKVTRKEGREDQTILILRELRILDKFVFWNVAQLSQSLVIAENF